SVMMQGMVINKVTDLGSMSAAVPQERPVFETTPSAPGGLAGLRFGTVGFDCKNGFKALPTQQIGTC
ncbi:hypothetical protein, partial [Methyloglobulus sp.]|uniref:hypothetical protein n=1 Tax=Methyloglobulus sp. TaxID=2518622 RepID=UPI0032B6FADA